MNSKNILKTVPLEIVSLKNNLGASNAIVINATLNDLRSQGYKLVSTSTNTYSNFPVGVTNYLFEK